MTTPTARWRIDDAKRAGAIERLVGDGIPPEWVDRWLVAWDTAADGEARHAGDSWMRAAGRLP